MACLACFSSDVRHGGLRVFIPRAIWPDYACDECGGHGWLAQVVKTVKQKSKKYKDYIVVEFSFARDARGKPFEPAELPLHGLELFVAWPPFSDDESST